MALVPIAKKPVVPGPSLAKITGAAAEKNSVSEESTQSQASQPGSVTGFQVATLVERGLSHQAEIRLQMKEAFVNSQTQKFEGGQHTITPQQSIHHQASYRNFYDGAQEWFIANDEICESLYSANPGRAIFSRGAHK